MRKMHWYWIDRGKFTPIWSQLIDKSFPLFRFFLCDKVDGATGIQTNSNIFRLKSDIRIALGRPSLSHEFIFMVAAESMVHAMFVAKLPIVVWCVWPGACKWLWCAAAMPEWHDVMFYFCFNAAFSCAKVSHSIWLLYAWEQFRRVFY